MSARGTSPDPHGAREAGGELPNRGAQEARELEKSGSTRSQEARESVEHDNAGSSRIRGSTTRQEGGEVRKLEDPWSITGQEARESVERDNAGSSRIRGVPQGRKIDEPGRSTRQEDRRAEEDGVRG